VRRLIRRWRSSKHELIWLVGVGIAAALILIANPALDHPWGSNWPHYFESAQFFWDPTSAYFDWRTPMYPYLLATLGQHLGFVGAAQLIAQLSAVLLVLGAGLLGRATSGPVVGAIAALSVPALQCAVESATWSNMYPLAAAVMGLALAAGAVTARWPTLVGAGIAAGFAGLAWQLNHLGLVAVPMTIGLIALGMVVHIPRRRWPLWALVVALGMGGPVAVDQWIVSRFSVPQTELSKQVLQRRTEELERIRDSPDGRVLFPGCTDFDPKPLNIDELTNRCARQMLANSYGTLRAEDCAPPAWMLLLLIPVALLPASWARGRAERVASSLSTGLLVGGPAAAILLGAAWTNYSEKYMLAFVPVMVLLIPLGGARLGALVGGFVGHMARGRAVGWIAAGLWVALIWPQPQGFEADAPRIQRSWETMSGEAAAWARSEMDPGDLLLDCVPLRVDLALLPDVVPYRFGIGIEADCREWLKHPPDAQGTVWLIHRTFAELPQTHRAAVASYGWETVHDFGGGHTIWRRRATTQPSHSPPKITTPPR
jgi:hypothetical protein